MRKCKSLQHINICKFVPGILNYQKFYSLNQLFIKGSYTEIKFSKKKKKAISGKSSS